MCSRSVSSASPTSSAGVAWESAEQAPAALRAARLAAGEHRAEVMPEAERAEQLPLAKDRFADTPNTPNTPARLVLVGALLDSVARVADDADELFAMSGGDGVFAEVAQVADDAGERFAGSGGDGVFAEVAQAADDADELFAMSGGDGVFAEVKSMLEHSDFERCRTPSTPTRRPRCSHGAVVVVVARTPAHLTLPNNARLRSAVASVEEMALRAGVDELSPMPLPLRSRAIGTDDDRCKRKRG